jgi:hypothetical protein
MGIINKSFTFVGGTTKANEASQVNADFDALYTLVNGNVDDANVAANANIQQSKILNLVTDLITIRAERVTECNLLFFQASGTYTKPTDLRFAHIICIGAGGGGAGASSSSASFPSAGGGGGSGAYTEGWFNAASIPSSVAAIIGTGGAGGGLLGATGQTSQFGALLNSAGGAGGDVAADSVGNGGAGGAGALGQITLPGIRGEAGFVTTAPFPLAKGGSGGALGQFMIHGTGIVFGGVADGVGGTLGGGGAGAVAVNGSAIGGPGGHGFVLIVEFKS